MLNFCHRTLETLEKKRYIYSTDQKKKTFIEKWAV